MTTVWVMGTFGEERHSGTDVTTWRSLQYCKWPCHIWYSVTRLKAGVCCSCSTFRASVFFSKYFRQYLWMHAAASCLHIVKACSLERDKRKLHYTDKTQRNHSAFYTLKLFPICSNLVQSTRPQLLMHICSWHRPTVCGLERGACWCNCTRDFDGRYKCVIHKQTWIDLRARDTWT